MTTGVLSTSFPRYPGDFAGCFVEDALRASATTGETFEVIAAGDHGTPAGDAGDSSHDDGPERGPTVRVLRIAMPVVRPGAALFFGAGAPEALERGGARVWAQALFFWAALCERARARAPFWDRIVAHWLVPSALAARAVAPHLPLTAYAHSGDIALLERIPGGATIGRQLARGIDDLIFVSADLRRRFARLTGISAGRLAPLTVSRSSSAAAPALGPAWNGDVASRRDGADPLRRTLDCGGTVLLSVGRLVPIKGFDILLRAVALATATAGATRAQHRTTVVILGEGPERARLEAMARRLKVDLRLPGTVPREEVRRWMEFADVYVQPSRRLPSGRTEGLPVSTLEALSAGLPLVASATGGLAELDRGTLVTAGDAQALAEGLTRNLRHLGSFCVPSA